MKKLFKKPIFWVISGLLLVAIVWTPKMIRGFQKQQAEQERFMQEEADRIRYPWRYMQLNSYDDVRIGNMEIANSKDLADEEKVSESAKLYSRFYDEKALKGESVCE